MLNCGNVNDKFILVFIYKGTKLEDGERQSTQIKT